MRKGLTIAAIAAGALALGSQAQAAPVLTLVICQGITCNTYSATTGTVTVGDYTLSVTANYVEGANLSQAADVTLNLQRLTDNSTDSLDVWLEATGYTLPAAPGYRLTSTFASSESGDFGTSSSVVTDQAWLNTSNASLGAGPSIPGGSVTNGLLSCTLTPDSNGVASCNQTGGAVLTAAGTAPPFSIFDLTRFSVALGDRGLYGATVQATVTPVPEPGSMLLFGTGLIGVGTALRRRWSKRA